MKWNREGEIFEGGDVGGDYQVSDAWSIRYRSAENPRLVVDVHFFGEAETEYCAENYEGPYHITRLTEPTILREDGPTPLTDLDDEIWSDGRYETVQKDVVVSGIPIKALNSMARDWADMHKPEMITWDGTREGWGR